MWLIELPEGVGLGQSVPGIAFFVIRRSSGASAGIPNSVFKTNHEIEVAKDPAGGLHRRAKVPQGRLECACATVSVVPRMKIKHQDTETAATAVDVQYGRPSCVELTPDRVTGRLQRSQPMLLDPNGDTCLALAAVAVPAEDPIISSQQRVREGAMGFLQCEDLAPPSQTNGLTPFFVVLGHIHRKKGLRIPSTQTNA
jgi:hypothetical protein